MDVAKASQKVIASDGSYQQLVAASVRNRELFAIPAEMTSSIKPSKDTLASGVTRAKPPKPSRIDLLRKRVHSLLHRYIGLHYMSSKATGINNKVSRLGKQKSSSRIFIVVSGYVSSPSATSS